MIRNPRQGLVAVLFAFAVTTPVGADDKKAVLDCAANDRLFDTHFTRFGPSATKGILRDGKGIRFKLPPMKDPGHTGLYSYVVLAGDFEISARFEWAGVPIPKTGYGASAGITVDTDGPAGSLSLARANLPKVGGSFVIIRGQPGPKGPTFDTSHEATRAAKGRLVIRREKAELICFVAEGDGEPHEFRRVPFAETTVRQVRIYADPGGSDTELDARIFDFRIFAEEITGNVPERDKPRGFGWWAILTVLLVGVGGYAVWRRSKAR
jgi:hypothetical protein